MPANIDEFLATHSPRAGAPAGAPPANIDEFLTRNPTPKSDGIMSGHEWDATFSADTPGGRILSAIGAGAMEQWGAKPLGWDTATEDFLKEHDALSSTVSAVLGPDSPSARLIKGYSEAFIRPLAWAAGMAEVASRDFGAIQEGAAAGVAQIGQELEAVPGISALQPGRLARDIAGAIETGDPLIGSPGTLRVQTPRYVTDRAARAAAQAAETRAANEAAVRALNPELLRRGNMAVEPALNPDLYPPRATIPEARALGVIGEGDAGYFDLVTPTPEAQAARDAANAEVLPRESTLTMEGPDIDGIARQRNPDLFARYDPLVMQRDALSRQLADWRGDALDRIDADIRSVEMAPARASKGREIAALQREREAFVNYEGEPPQIAEARQRYLELDNQVRDLAPEVNSAYRDAAGAPEAPAEAAPAPEAAPAAEVAPEAEPAAPAPAAAIPEATPTPGAPPLRDYMADYEAAQVSRATANIATDISQKLVAVGRPQEEADAVGAVQAARYTARSANLAGTTPEGLYAEESRPIVGGTAAGKLGEISVADARAPIRIMANADASTAIHEFGHSYLEELTRDAADDRATPAVVADAEAVRDWLGEGHPAAPRSPSGFTRAQHEKFARGFERYMMEGRAPSEALAGVFAKFKDWLTQIYQTVSRLRSPITDDIRSVFDRMLAAPERPTTIVPERATTPADFAARHENLAEHTAPAEAGVVANHIREEADEIAAEKAPAIHAELATATGEQSAGSAESEPAGAPGPGGDVTGNAAAPLESDRNATAPEPVGADAGIARPTGAVGQGGVEAAPEGGAIRAGEAGTATRAAAEPDLEPGPAGPIPTAIPDSDTRLVDKAGNIRLDNINSPEDWKEALRQAAERNADFGERRRGVVTDAQRNALANVLGTTPGRVLTKEIGESFTDSEIKMLEKGLAQSTAHVVELGAKAVETGSDADIAAATSALLRHDMIQGLYSQATAEAGRSLRALRRSQEFWTSETSAQSGVLRQALLDATGRSPEQMLKLFQKIQTLNQVGQTNKFIRNALKPGLFDYIEAVYINALLSGPITHATYTAAGQIFAFYRDIGETPAAALIGSVRRGLGIGPAEYADIREVGAQTYGHLSGALSGAQAAWTAVKENRQILPPEVQANLPTAGGTAMGRQNVIPGTVGTILEAPMRMVNALHSFNWTTFYEQAKSARAFEIAQGEGLPVGSRAFAARVANLTQNPTQAMIEAASKEATGGALMSRPAYDSFMGKLGRALHHGITFPDIPLPGGRSLPLGTFRPGMYIDPFIQIKANILRQTFGRGTPLALFSQEVRDDLMMKNGGVAFDLRAGKLLAGTTLMLGAGGLYYLGHLNDSGPTEPEKAYWWRRTHGMPHGLNVGNLSFNLLRMGNLGMQMSVAADLAHLVGDIPSGDGAKIAADLVHAVSQNILDESFASGPQKMLEAINNSDRYGPQWIRQFVSSAIPYSVGLRQLTRLIDPYTRQVRSTMDAIKNTISPMTSETLLPKYDFWGQPVPNQGWAITAYEHLQNDPVDQKLNALGVTPRMPQRTLRGVQLTDDQYADYSREGGRLARQQVEAILGLPDFSSRPPGVQIDLIDKAIGVGHRAAAAKIIVQSRVTGENSIIDIAKQRKASHIETGAPVRQPAR